MEAKSLGLCKAPTACGDETQVAKRRSQRDLETQPTARKHRCAWPDALQHQARRRGITLAQHLTVQDQHAAGRVGRLHGAAHHQGRQLASLGFGQVGQSQHGLGRRGGRGWCDGGVAG